MHDLKNGSWVILTSDDVLCIEEQRRADSLRICGSNQQLPRDIDNDESYRFGGPGYTEVELEILRDEARQLALVVPGRDANVEGQRVARRCLNEKSRVAYSVDNHESGRVVRGCSC